MTAGPYIIQKEWATTYCDDRHPVRLGRDSEHYQGEPSARRAAIDERRRGYLCPGGEEHLYPLWVVFNGQDDREANVDSFDRYADAVECRDRMNRKAAACA